MDKRADRKRKESRSCLFRGLIQRQVTTDDVSYDNSGNISSNSQGSNPTAAQGDVSASWTDGDVSLSSEEYLRYNRSLLSLQPWIFRKANHKDGSERDGVLTNECDYRMSGLLPNDKGPQFRLGSRLGSLGCRRLQRFYVDPLNSVENCFTSQVRNEHLRIDEYVFSSLPSPVATLRPLLITDQSRIISRSEYDSSGMQPGNEEHKNAHGVSSSIQSEILFHKEAGGLSSGVLGTLAGIPPLPKSRKLKTKIEEVPYGSSHILDPRKSSHSKGSLHGLLFFCLGISFGSMISVHSNRIEVDKLNKLLKHSENLVQDLQEDLEMKDSLTVNELVNETCASQENHSCPNVEESIDLFLEQKPKSHFTERVRDGYDSQYFHMPPENPQSPSKIEAELEAELERLEQSVTASDLQRRVFELCEFDPDLIGDVVQGELRADMLGQGTLEGQPDGNSTTDGTFTTRTYNANYSVSPRELSLRLHEIIQIRLEERIKELETALLQTQGQLQIMEAERTGSQKASNSDIGSSNQESPTVLRSNCGFSHPFCLNLSGDALCAYDEAYEEFMKITETNSPPSSVKTSRWINGYIQNQSDQSQDWELESGKGNKLITGNLFEREPTWEQILSSRESNNIVEGVQEYSDDESDDEEGRKLIQQIMEKTRQGSPAVLYAQRMLSLMDEIL